MTGPAPTDELDELLEELRRAASQSTAAAEAAAVAAAGAREGYQIGRALVRRERQRRLDLARAALNRATEQTDRPRPVDLRAVELEHSAAAAIAVARPGDLLTLYVDQDEEGRPRLVQLPPGVSPEALRAMRAVVEEVA